MAHVEASEWPVKSISREGGFEGWLRHPKGGGGERSSPVPDSEGESRLRRPLTWPKGSRGRQGRGGY